MNIRRNLQSYLLAAAILLTSFPVGISAQQSSPSASTQTSAQTQAFKFGKIDLELLEQMNLLDQRFEKEGLVYHDLLLDPYLDRVGQAVVADKQLENVNWKFHALRDAVPNAVALPNGSIYINTGLLALLDNETQLASVLAHEATHVSRRHTYIQNRNMRKKILAINILNAVAAWNPVGGVAGAAIDLIANISPLMLALSIFGYSRELEKEADMEGLKNLTAAGYSPQEMVSTFQILQKDIEGEQIESFYSDHPKLKERINYLSTSIGPGAKKMSDEELKTAKAEYLAFTEQVDRQAVELAILSERFHTAAYISQKLVDYHPDSSTNVRYLADSYRALGPRVAELTAKDLTGGAKKKEAKNRNKRTLEERDAELLKTVAGQQAWNANQEKSEQLYSRALQLDRFNYQAHRGLGMLYEKLGRKEEAAREYLTYLELAPPNTADTERFKRRLEMIKASLANDGNPPKPSQENHQ